MCIPGSQSTVIGIGRSSSASGLSSNPAHPSTSMLRHSHSSVQHFDIELHGNAGRRDNIVILTGAPLEASANHLTGQLVLSTLEVTQIRQITVKLAGTMDLHWSVVPVAKGSQLPLQYSRRIYEDEFSDFDIPGRVVPAKSLSRVGSGGSLSNLASYFNKPQRRSNEGISPLSAAMAIPATTGTGGSSNGVSADSASHSPHGSPAHSPVVSRPASSANLQEIVRGSSPTSSPLQKDLVHQLPPGSYVFPFEVYIPGEMVDSIEGNKYAHLVYWLTATVERGAGKSSLKTQRHIRVVRTVGVDSFDVAHTVSIENTWPKKIEYKISVPNRAAAFGSQLELQFALVPLDKGLRLGRIRAEIIEYVELVTPVSQPREEETVVARQFFEPPADFDHMSDEWVLYNLMNMPQSLSRATQDTKVNDYVKITHKFRCFISLINRDGHTSELRASLPITLYIAPDIYVTENSDLDRPQPSVTTNKKSFGSLTALTGDHHHHHKEQPHDEPVFNVEPPPFGRSPSALSIVQNNQAPPAYSHHVFDRLYSTVATPAESPTRSGAATPQIHAAGPTMDLHQQALLAHRLQAIAASRQNPYQNMSRQSSYQGARTGRSPVQTSRIGTPMDVNALSRVPSYEAALNEQAAPDFAPQYTD